MYKYVSGRINAIMWRTILTSIDLWPVVNIIEVNLFDILSHTKKHLQWGLLSLKCKNFVHYFDFIHQKKYIYINFVKNINKCR